MRVSTGFCAAHWFPPPAASQVQSGHHLTAMPSLQLEPWRLAALGSSVALDERAGRGIAETEDHALSPALRGQEVLWRAGGALRAQVEADRTSSVRNGTGGGIITGFPLSLSFVVPPEDACSPCLCLLTPVSPPSPQEALGSGM